MIRLPEKIRNRLDKLIKNLKTRETIFSISLFGSWSRGDAEPSSDVDLLIADNQIFDNEYTERIEQNGILIDLNYVPQKWITGSVPPEIDQKIYEAYVLYDKEWTITNTKEQMMSSYYSPERLKIRAENRRIGPATLIRTRCRGCVPGEAPFSWNRRSLPPGCPT